MKAQWKIRPVGELCDILDSKRRPITKKDRTSGEFPYYGATGILDYVDDYIFDEKLVLIGEDGAKWGAGENTAFAAEGKYWVNNHAHVIRPHRDIVLDEWIIYHLNANDLSPFISGLTVPKLNQAKLRNVPLPLPPLPEQKRIVAILDEALDGIAAAVANAEKNLANARELFESYLNSVFTQKGEGWVEKRLSEVSKDFGRGKSKHRPRNDPKLYGGRYPFIQTGDVRNASHLITSYSQTYSDAGLAQSKLWPKGTLCITIAANIAETGILTFDSCFPDSVIGAVVDDKSTSNKFLEYLLQNFKSRLQAHGKGSAQDNINLGTFESQTFPFPSLNVQNELVASLDSLRESTHRLAAPYQRKLAALAELQQAILYKAFAGELTSSPEKALKVAAA